MYLLLDDTILDEKKHYLFNGTLYDAENKVVGNIFDDGIKHSDLKVPFTLVLDESESLLKGRIKTDMITGFVQRAGMLFLASPAAQKVLEEHSRLDIKMYDIDIRSASLDVPDYKIVKVLDKIDCVDLEKSDLDYDSKFDSIDSAESIVLNENKIPADKQIFLLGKRATGIIMIHENLKNVIEDAGLTGFNFFPLEEAHMVIS